MKKYEILEHTTDLKIRAFGKTKEELFSNMLEGMFESIKPEVKNLKKKVARKIIVKSADEKSLLVDFLNEAIGLSDINNEAYFEARFDKLIDAELVGRIFGQPVEKFGVEIKAVTYHGVELKKVGEIWEAEVLFDI